MVKKNLNTIINFYKSRINKYGTTNKGLAWESKKNNNLRYTEIAKLIKTKFNSKINILDFGCGISGLYKFLKKNKINHNYVGVDTSKIIIDYCKKKFKENVYFNLNILNNKKKLGKYDLIVLNGIFTIKSKLSENEMYDYIFLILKKLRKNCNGYIIINFFIERPDWKNKYNFYPNYSKLIKMIKKKICNNVKIKEMPKIFENLFILKFNEKN